MEYGLTAASLTTTDHPRTKRSDPLPVMSRRSKKRIGGCKAPKSPEHNQCGEDVEHEGDEFCSLKFRGDLLKNDLLWVQVGDARVAGKIHQWIESPVMKLILSHFKEAEIEDTDNYAVLAWTLGCVRSPKGVLLVEAVVKLSTQMTGVAVEGEGGRRERQFRRLAMTVRNMVDACEVPGSVARDGA